MQFSHLVRTEADIKATDSRIAKVELIRILLKEAGPDATKVAMMITGNLTRPLDPRVTGIKETFLANDLALDAKALEDIIEAAGARLVPFDDPRDSWAVETVWDAFQRYLDAPHSMQNEKSAFITSLMEMAPDQDHISFLFRLLVGKMSNGVQEATVLAAISDGDEDVTKRAYNLRPDLWAWVEAWASPKVFIDVAEARPMLFTPLKPQLCDRVKDIGAILTQYHPNGAFVQDKYDGERIHIHRRGDEVRIYTRKLKDVTGDYPEVAKAALELDSDEYLLDGELVAVTREGDILPFEFVQKRLGRKARRHEIQVGVVFYDCLVLDGEDLTWERYDWRLPNLLGLLPMEHSVFRVAKTTFVDGDEGPGVLRSMLLDAHENGREGLVCKDPASIYSPDYRGTSKVKPWIKLKAAYMEDSAFGDTVDLVVVGFNWGRGKHHGKVGALWLAAPVDHGRYADQVLLCKVGTGLQDVDREWWTAQEMTSGELPKEMDGAFLDVHVVEIRADEVSRNKDGNISLRFPRYIRRRDDKGPEDATTIDELAQVIG